VAHFFRAGTLQERHQRVNRGRSLAVSNDRSLRTPAIPLLSSDSTHRNIPDHKVMPSPPSYPPTDSAKAQPNVTSMHPKMATESRP
jgi:hypothetical protein